MILLKIRNIYFATVFFLHIMPKFFELIWKIHIEFLSELLFTS